MDKMMEEVGRTIRAAIKERGRTNRLIALMVATTLCVVVLRLG